MAVEPARLHPVRLVVSDDLRRARLTVLFRPLLALPHAIWFVSWSLAVIAVLPVAWIFAVATCSVPPRLRRFFAAWMRYRVHVIAFLALVGRRFPGFTGAEGYGIDVVVEPAARLARWKVVFRLPLALPALLLDVLLMGGFALLAVVGWAFALVRGQMPARLRDLGAARLRYGARTRAYVLLLTDRYPSFRRP